MCDLKKAGAFKYSLDPTTQPTCLAFKVHGGPKVYFLPFEMINSQWHELPQDIRVTWSNLIKYRFEFSAHNAFFEKCIYTNILVHRYGWPEIPLTLYRCTAAKAAACALPRALEGAGHAMRLSTQKDKNGYVAMMATCKPTKKWKAWHDLKEKVAQGKRINEKTKKRVGELEPKVFLEPEDDPQVWQTLYRYCQIDVLTEEKLDDALPDLIPEEQEIWHLNQTLNWRGLRIDIPTTHKVVDMIETDSKEKLEELDILTMGLIVKGGATKAILEFMAFDGIVLPNLRAKTVDDAIKEVTGDMKRLLELRKALSMTSTRKYQTFLARANPDHRVRDILLYHGASTGRDTGTGIQPHNFPKGVIKVPDGDPYCIVNDVIEWDHEMLRILYGDSLPLVFSAILRNMIMASDGYELFVADYAKIEVAVIWWLAGNEAGLRILREGRDPYIYQAASNLGKTYEEVDEAVKAKEAWALDARQLGKAQILGCGFGMGWQKFMSTAWDFYRLKLSEEQSLAAVTNYREANAAVPLLWKDYEKHAIAAVENPGVVTEVAQVKFRVSANFLWVKLPSGRKLAYRDPELTMRETDYGPRKSLAFYAVNSKTKKWGLEFTWGGTLTENIVQAVARDLMMTAIVRLEKAGYRALLTVHDEALCEAKKGVGDLEEFKRIMCEKPPWAEGLPLAASGWCADRYRK